MPDSKKPEKNEWVKTLGLFSVIITDIVAYSGGGLLVGYLAWTYLGLPQWTMAITSLAGLGMAMMKLYHLSKKWFDEP